MKKLKTIYYTVFIAIVALSILPPHWPVFLFYWTFLSLFCPSHNVLSPSCN